MLHSFNVLYPHFYNSVSTDDFIVSAKALMDAQESVINQNEIIKYLGHTMIPTFIVDVDDDNFEIQDIFGNNITSKLAQIFYNMEWHTVSYSDSILKTDPLYSKIGTKIYSKINKENNLIRRTLFREDTLDYYILSQSPLVKYEFFINANAGCYIIGSTDETVVSVDSANFTITTNLGTYSLRHIDIVDTYSVDDIIPKYTIIDKIFTVTPEDGMTIVTVNPSFSHLSNNIKSDINLQVRMAV